MLKFKVICRNGLCFVGKFVGSLSKRAGCCHSCSCSAFYMIFWCSTKHHKTISSWISLYICFVIGIRYERTLLMDHPGVSQPPNALNSLWCHWTIYDMTHQDETCNSLTQGCPETGSKGGAQCALWCFSEDIRSDQHTVCLKKLSSFSISHSFPHLFLMILGQHANTTEHFVKFKHNSPMIVYPSQLTADILRVLECQHDFKVA